MGDAIFLFGYIEDNQTKFGFQKHNSLYALDNSIIPSFDWLMQNVPSEQLTSTLDSAIGESLSSETVMTLKGLLQQQPVWASGVTYKQSEEARERESHNSTIYTRVYLAERPELFWKSTGEDIVSSGDFVGIRYDATWSVPEPELTMVINARKEFIGFTIGNDMSSRDIEGENALYLPQAKVYDDACAIGPRIWLQPDASEWGDLEIHSQIERAGEVIFSGTTSTAQIKRSLSELMDYLLRCKRFPHGVFLMTGTGIVPPDEFTLEAGDVIRIRIEPIGELVNIVHVVGDAL